MRDVTFCVLLSVLCAIVKSEVLVVSSPRITKKPQDQIFYEVFPNCGETAKPLVLECEAEGLPNPKYHWKRDGNNIKIPSAHYKISSNSGRLIILNPKSNQEGYYQCFATNYLGTAMSNIIRLRRVYHSPSSVNKVMTIKLEHGKSLKMECKVPNAWLNPHVYWIIQESNGSFKYINESSRITMDSEKNLWFSNVILEDATKKGSFYRCMIYYPDQDEYKFGLKYSLKVSTSILDSIERGPERLFATNNVYDIEEGTDAELYCIFGGFPTPEVQWINGTNNTPIAFNDRFSTSNFNKKLFIRNVTIEDEANYVCKVSNEVSTTTHNINLKVYKKPFFTREPENQHVEYGQNVTLRCEAEGIPPPKIYWIFNGTQKSNSVVKNNTLHFDHVDQRHIGVYGCSAQNPFGYVYKEVYLSLQEKR